MHTFIPVMASTEPNTIFVAVMGVATVMIGLTCIIFLTALMSRLCQKSEGGAETKQSAKPTPAASPAAPAAAPAIPNRAELIAAVTAAVAEELGTDVSALRVRSFRAVGQNAAPVQNAERGELVAAISAAVAEELGTDVSAIRIRSLKKIN